MREEWDQREEGRGDGEGIWDDRDGWSFFVLLGDTAVE